MSMFQKVIGGTVSIISGHYYLGIYTALIRLCAWWNHAYEGPQEVSEVFQVKQEQHTKEWARKTTRSREWIAYEKETE